MLRLGAAQFASSSVRSPALTAEKVSTGTRPQSSGEMRLIRGEHDITMRPGEAAEFDTQLPHWFGPAGNEPVEILSVHGSHGQRMHVRAAPRRTRPPA